MLSMAVAQTPPVGSPVAKHGQLKVSGNSIVDKDNSPVQLRGMSLFWSHDNVARTFYNATAIGHLASQWQASLVRAPMAIRRDNTSWGGPTYLESTQGRTDNRQRVLDVVAAARTHGIYVIIDWHSYNAHQNSADQLAAANFFVEMAKLFNGVPNVIYEIYNEPIGPGGSFTATPTAFWQTIKPYMQAVTDSIRRHDQNNLILIGSPNWCQHPDVAAADSVRGSNLAYTFHFYAGADNNDHKGTLRTRVDAARALGKAVFASEIGTTHQNGGRDGHVNSHNPTEANTWMNFMQTRNISWAAWSLTRDPQSSAAIASGEGTSPGNWQLSTSGQYFHDRMRQEANTPITVTSVAVFPAAVSVPRGGSRQFVAQVTGTGGPAQTVTWSRTGNSSDQTTINSSTGVLSIAANETATTITVRATSTVNTGVSGIATVTVGSQAAAFTLDDFEREEGNNLNYLEQAWYYVVASATETGAKPLETATAANHNAIITNAGPKDDDGPMSFVRMPNNSLAGNLTAAQVRTPANGSYVAAMRFVNIAPLVGVPGGSVDPTYARSAGVGMATEVSTASNVGIGSSFNTVETISFDMWAPTGMRVIFKLQTTNNASGNDNAYKNVVVGTGSWTTHNVKLTGTNDRAPIESGTITGLSPGVATPGVGTPQNICAPGGGIAGDLCQEQWYGTHFTFNRANVTALAWQVNAYGDYGNAVDGNNILATLSNNDRAVLIDNIKFDNFTSPIPQGINISTATVTVTGTYTYTGNLITPTITVANGATTLTQGTHYIYSVTSGGTDAGEATVTVTGIGDYIGTTTQTFTINKAAAPPFGTVSARNVTYTPTLTLANVTLPAGYAWNTPSTPLAVANSGQTFAATFTEPSGNYLPATGTIRVDVAKASIGDFTPEDLHAVYGDVLSGVELPEGWEWDAAGSTPVGDAGEREHKASLADFDPDNYEDGNWVGVNFKIIVAKANINISGVTFANKTVFRDGNPHSILIGGTLPNGVSVEYDGNEQTEAGAHIVTAMFKLTEALEANHIVVPATMTATLTINNPNSVLSPDRKPPVSNPDVSTAAPVTVLAGEFTAGPNPVDKSSGVIKFFWQGKRIKSSTLNIFDASGNRVNKVRIAEKSAGTSPERREVGSWNLKDSKGRAAAEGTYLVKGVITVDGKKEKVSLVFGVR